MRIRIIPNLVLIAVWFWLGVAASLASEQLVWRIGKFNDSSGEFRSQGINYADPQSDPVYRVGQSKDAEDWQRFRPGPANGLAGGRQHPFTILFSLSSPPRGIYRLKIGILHEIPRLSYLQASINGHTGLFYFHPKLNYAAGDWEGTYAPQTSTDSKTIEFPAAWLHPGENRLVLTALDDPATPEIGAGAIGTGHTALVYDALELTQDAQAKYDSKRVQASALPSIFYRNTPSGLAEVVEVYADFATMPKEAETQLQIGGKTYRESAACGREFGELRTEFEVPEWSGPAAAVLAVGSKKSKRRFPVELTPAKKWTVLIVPHEHLDIGFTDYVEKVAELQSQSVDGAMELIQKFPEFRWTLDAYWVLEKYLAGRSPAKQAQLLQALRDGKVVLPIIYSSQHTGTASLEGLIRSLYPSHFFGKNNSIPVGAAHITDVPSYTWSYASVLHDAGVKYFAAASNGWRGPVLLQGRWNEKSPFYWEGPDGGRVLMWYSRAYMQLGTLFALPPHVTAVHDSLPIFLQAYSRPDYKANSVIVYGSQLENTPLTKEQAEIARAWQKDYAWPRLEFSTFGEAMASIEKEFDGQIPVVHGDFGPYWEDGFGSDSNFTALHRRNQQRIQTAEKMGTIPSLLNPTLRPDRQFLSRAWENLLLSDEHSWGYVGATEPQAEQTSLQTELKVSRAIEAEHEITESIHRSSAQWASFLGPKDASAVVFNSLSWPRSGLVALDLPEGSGIFDPVSGAEVPYETLYVGKLQPLPGFGGAYRRVAFRAEKVPAMGYKLYALRPTKSGPSGQSMEPGTSVESPYYRLRLDPASGAIESVWDKELGKELVDQKSPYRFGAYLYVTGADDMPNNSLYRYGAALPPPELKVNPAANGRLVSVRSVPFGTIIEMESSAPHTPSIRTVITLYNSEKKIGFKYQLRKEYVLTKEGVYIAFPFAVENPSFAYETQNAWVNPARDTLAGGCREWFAVNHWVAVHGTDVAAAVIPLDAPLANLGDIARGLWPTEFAPRSATIFSWLMNNYWGTNFVAGQGGEFTFRYDLVTGRNFDPPSLTRTGWESMTPLEVDLMGAASAPGALPSDQATLLKIDNPNVVSVTWKLAEDGHGSIIRLEEISGRPSTVHLSSQYLNIAEAWRCSALEDDSVQLPVVGPGVEVEMKPFEITTLRLVTKPSNPQAPQAKPADSR